MSSLESLDCLKRPDYGGIRYDVLHPLGPANSVPNILLMWWHLARRLQLSPWESSVVNRLLTPTHSFLARSKSTAALSGDTGKVVQAQLSGEVQSSFRSLSSHVLLTPPPFSWCVLPSVGVGSVFLALFPLCIHCNILSGHQTPGRQMTPPHCDHMASIYL